MKGRKTENVIYIHSNVFKLINYKTITYFLSSILSRQKEQLGVICSKPCITSICPYPLVGGSCSSSCVGPEVNRVSSRKNKDGHEDEENDDKLEFARMKSKRMS